MRTCVGCGGRDGQNGMLRLQLLDGQVEAVGRSVAGRSAYVHARGECIARIGGSRLLRRSLRVDLDKSARVALADRVSRASVVNQPAGEPSDDSSRTI
jgi:predicted RNA-binding protein YlxR (DUF448 family)